MDDITASIISKVNEKASVSQGDLILLQSSVYTLITNRVNKDTVLRNTTVNNQSVELLCFVGIVV